MKVLVVFAHPRRKSFTGALLDSFLAGLDETGHEALVVDLYREGFDVLLKPADYAQYEENTPMPDDVLHEQARIEAADALAFVFPVWWWSFPAILKGWIDRVWSWGWAYGPGEHGSKGLLRHRKAVLLASAGGDEALYREYGYRDAMEIQLDQGIMGYCGLADVDSHVFYDVDTNAAARARHLRRARALGRSFADCPPPGGQ